MTSFSKYLFTLGRVEPDVSGGVEARENSNRFQDTRQVAVTRNHQVVAAATNNAQQKQHD